MTDDTRSRAFEPFFTTKPVGEGAGLGLAVAFGIVESLGGSLSIASTPGEGTTVSAAFPAAQAEKPSLPSARPPVVGPAPRPERVLVAEDRKIVRELAHNILAEAGFEVVSAASGDEALVLTAQAEPFDLVLTDVVMPQMSGPELARVLRDRNASLPVIYMSGYTDDVLDAAPEAASDASKRVALLRP